MEILIVILLVVLGCLFPAYLIDAIRAADEAVSADKRGKACATFGGILFLLILILN